MKKFLPYIFIAIILTGLFSLSENVSAQAQPTVTGCYNAQNQIQGTPPLNQTQCTQLTNSGANVRWVIVAGTTTPTDPCLTSGALGTPAYITCQQNLAALGIDNTPATTTPSGPSQTYFQNLVNKGCEGITTWTFSGCITKLFYIVFYVIPATLLWFAAYLFNVLISVSISDDLFKHEFVSDAWTIVRDVANIFFILILIYVGIQTILGIAHGTKRMIAGVVIMALLINFSMFFTKVVIDTSNILALIFYSKLQVNTSVSKTDGAIVERPYASVAGEKDVAGGMVSAFDPTTKLDSKFFDRAKEIYVNGVFKGMDPEVPMGKMIMIILMAGSVMLFATYALFMSGFSFIGRLIELWVLLIFSPFAFMSYAVPQLGSVERIGWASWLKRLIASAFMAPIFMFFLYFIFLLIHSKIFESVVSPAPAGTQDESGLIKIMLGIMLPTALILSLLLMATRYAKKGSGHFGEAALGIGKMLTGLAIGVASGGTALAGRAAIGATAKLVQNTNARGRALTFKDTTEKWKSGKYLGATTSAVGNLATKFAPAVAAAGLHKVGIGKKLKEADEGYGHKTHATHILDAKMQSEFGHQYGKESKYKDLTESEQKIVKAEVDKDEMAKFEYGKLFKDLEAPQAAAIQARYRGAQYTDPNTGTLVTPAGPERPISDSHGNTNRIDHAAPGPGEKIKSEYFVDTSKASAALGEFAQALRKGSYDVRSLPDMSAKSKGFPKLGVALIAGVAAGVRLGLKKGVGVEYGTPQKDILKDIGNTITESLKNVKINVSGGGGGHDKDDHAKDVKSVGH